MLALKLQTKILISLGIIVFVVLGTSTFFHIQSLKRSYLETIEGRAEGLVQMILSETISNYQLNGNTINDAILGILSISCKKLYDLNRNKKILHLGVINTKGIIVAHNDRAYWNKPIIPSLILQHQSRKMVTVLAGETYHVLIPMFADKNIYLGTVDLGFPKSIIDQKIRQLLRQTGSLLVVFVGLACLVISILLHILITKPIRRLATAGKMIVQGELNETTDTKKRVKRIVDKKKKKLDEVDELIIVFHDMIICLKTILEEITTLTQAVQKGDLDVRGNNDNFAGGWKDLVMGINNVIDAFVQPFSRTAEYLDHLSKGDIPEVIKEEYNGDFNKIKINLNMLIEATELTTQITEDIAEGNLNAYAIERSDQDRLMKALNLMIRRLNEFSLEMERLTSAVKEDALDIRGNTEAFEGGWRKLIDNMNSLISVLSESVAKNTSLSQEMELAKRIQTALLPSIARGFHPDFDIAAIMYPAEEVGGDFYDVSYDLEGKLWFGIGDVSGHGVTPGLIMMMALTAHTTMTTNFKVSACEIVTMLNKILFNNVQGRLGENQFMTFTALKYLGSGRFQHAGCHEDLIVYRKKQKICELIGTKGSWLNLMPDIGHVTENLEFCLDIGDLLVLFTDGMTEVWNEEGNMLDVQGLVGIVEKHAENDIEIIRDTIINDVMAWCNHIWHDDMSLVVVRRIV